MTKKPSPHIFYLFHTHCKYYSPSLLTREKIWLRSTSSNSPILSTSVMSFSGYMATWSPTVYLHSNNIATSVVYYHHYVAQWNINMWLDLQQSPCVHIIINYFYTRCVPAADAHLHGFLKLLLCRLLYAFVRVCPSLRLSMILVIWYGVHDMGTIWFVKRILQLLYGCIISGHSLWIKMHHRNHPFIITSTSIHGKIL